MKDEIILYEYLYQIILTQLHIGSLRSGQRFPSQQELCRQYNVGITTARRVLRMLESSGYIETSERRRATVVYEVDNQAYISAILQHREMILDIYSGFQWIIPVIQLGGARQITDFEKLESMISNIRDTTKPPELYALASGFLLELVNPYHNQIMCDLMADTEKFTNVPYLPISGLEDVYSVSPKIIRDALTRLLEAMRAGDYKHLERQLGGIYKKTRYRTKRYLDALEPLLQGTVEARPPQDFMIKTRVHLYTVIARQLYRRILGGEFSHCKYIPSIPDLMKEYSISQATAFKAIALLNDIGLVRTIDKKGTVIAGPETETEPLRTDIVTIGKNLVLFLDTLQILAVCSQSLARAVLSSMTKEQVLTAAAAWRQQDFHTSGDMVRALLEFFKDNAPCHSLHNFFEQMDYMLIWGHFPERRPLPIMDIDQRIGALFLHLSEALAVKDIEGFAGYVHQIFHSAFRAVRQLMISNGSNAECLPADLDGI